jgi:hypothetical protein
MNRAEQINAPDAQTPEKRDRRFAKTLAKGLQILQAFSPSDRALGNRELARRTGKATASARP